MKIIITLLLLASITSVYASDFQWSRLYHTRLNNFVRLTKLPVGEYLIGVYSTGNTIQEYSPTEPVVITNTKEVIKEVRIEVPVVTEKVVQVMDPKCTNGSVVFKEEDIARLRLYCANDTGVYNPTCVRDYLLYNSSLLK